VSEQPDTPEVDSDVAQRRALIEAIIYAAEEPLMLSQIAKGLDLPQDTVQADIEALVKQSLRVERGIEIRQVAKGYKMSTKAEHHEGVRKFVRTLRPKLKLSLPALETLAVVAYKQPVTVPEIQAIRGVNSTGVISTLLNRKLITTAGRKAVIGRPMQYKTTKDFLIQFGLSDLTELPTLKELEELGRAALGEIDEAEADESQAEQTGESPEPEAPEPEPAESEVTESPEPEAAGDSAEPEIDAPTSGRAESEVEPPQEKEEQS